jgi:hypothetical protein
VLVHLELIDLVAETINHVLVLLVLASTAMATVGPTRH